MRLSLYTALVVASSTTLVSAAVAPFFAIPTGSLDPLPLDAFKAFDTMAPKDHPNNDDDDTVSTNAVNDASARVSTAAAEDDTVSVAATCSNPRIRREWHSMSAADRTSFVNSIRCLMSRPSAGGFGASRSRYEDLVELHQRFTPNIHGNAKFLIWHRYYLWTFESILRDECGYSAALPWFDETKWAGRFSQSSIFSNDYFGPIHYPNGGCVTTGRFANLVLNVGPRWENMAHCLQRRGDGAVTGRITQSVINRCHSENTYHQMASCSEGQEHAFGHNGVGAVMSDIYSSPGDPVFFLHHAFVDHSYRIWQNQNPSRITAAGMSGRDTNGNPLTLSSTLNVGNLRPGVAIRDVIDTMSTTMCYRYDY